MWWDKRNTSTEVRIGRFPIIWCRGFFSHFYTTIMHGTPTTAIRPTTRFLDSVESCVPLERCNAPRSILSTRGSLPKRRPSLLVSSVLKNSLRLNFFKTLLTKNRLKSIAASHCSSVRKKRSAFLKSVRLFFHVNLRNCDATVKLERTLWLSQCVCCMHFGNSLTYGSVDDSGILILRIHRLWTVYEVATAGSPGRDTSTGHRVKSHDEPMLPTYVVECVHESILVKVDVLEYIIRMCTKPCP